MANEHVASLKGVDNDDPWYVIHADTPEAMESGLDFVITRGIGAKVYEAQAAYKAQLTAAKGLGAQVVTTLPGGYLPQTDKEMVPAPRVNVTSPPASAAPTCKHGAMQYRESKPDAAKKWRAYFCPTPRGTPDQCEPQWIKG